MSDYLINLAARTLNLTPVVHPRLASIFEPLSASAGSVGRLLFEGETEREGLASRESTLGINGMRSLTSQDDTMRPVMLPKPIPHVGDRAVSSHNDSEVQEGPFEPMFQHPTVTPTAPRFDPSSQVSNRDPVTLGWLRTQAHEPHDVQDNSARFSEGEANGDEVTPSRGQKIRSIETAQVDQSGATRSNDRDQVHPVLAHSTQGSRAAIAFIQPDRFVTPKRPVFAEPSSTPEVPPTISVTIGRVDVRAVFSQPSAPRVSRARQPAAMSLDEYLKQRSEGHR